MFLNGWIRSSAFILWRGLSEVVRRKREFLFRSCRRFKNFAVLIKEILPFLHLLRWGQIWFLLRTLRDWGDHLRMPCVTVFPLKICYSNLSPLCRTFLTIVNSQGICGTSLLIKVQTFYCLFWKVISTNLWQRRVCSLSVVLQNW